MSKKEFSLPKTYLEYGGYQLPNFNVLVPDVKKHMEWIQNFDSWESDILICTFPKSGTNWVYEIIQMLLAGNTDYIKTFKSTYMLELSPTDVYENMSTPRVINTHIPLRHLPKKHMQNGYKTIHVLRNPKDCAVSFYCHFSNDRRLMIECYPGKWEKFIGEYCENKYSLYDGWWNYEKEWETAKKNKDVSNVHTIFYEDLKINGVEEVKRLADYLGVHYTMDLLKEIEDKCAFGNLSKSAEHKQGIEQLKELTLDGSNVFFRKGEIGDWKNWFTVAQNEMFDATMEREMKKSSLKFTYEH